MHNFVLAGSGRAVSDSRIKCSPTDVHGSVGLMISQNHESSGGLAWSHTDGFAHTHFFVTENGRSGLMPQCSISYGTHQYLQAENLEVTAPTNV